MANHAKPSSQSQHFFRIILPHILENGTLELPRYFVKENWEHLSKHARLKLPNGEQSKMKLKKRNGKAWLAKGWQKFVEKYQIKCGYFLVFRYEGRSRFKVQIFDLSTIEIEYPRTSQENCKALLQVKEEVCVDDDDREMEVVNQFKKVRNGQNSSSTKEDKSCARGRVLQRAMAFQSPNPHFTIIMRPSYVSGTRGSSDLRIPTDGRRYFCKKGIKNMYLSLEGGDGRVWSMKFKILAPHRQVKICYSGWAKFWQENNLREGDICAFEVVDSSDVEFKVTIFRIADEEVDENGPIVNADISSPREMKEIPNDMQARKKKCGVSMKECSTQLQRARGNLRSGENSSSIKNKALEISARDPVLQRAKAFQSPDPHFTVVMKQAYVSNNPFLYIPAGPARSYFTKTGNRNIKLSLKGGDGRVWTMKKYIGASPHRTVIITSGWSKFSLENNLQIGDICAFELVTKTNEFEVTIFRNTDELVDKNIPLADEQVAKNDPFVPQGRKEIPNETQTRKRKCGVSVKECDTHLQRARGKLRSGRNSSSIKNKSLEISARDRVLQRAKAFQSPNPRFTIIMRPSYVSGTRGNSDLWIPTDGRRYFCKKGNKNMYLSLKGGDGRVWSMKFKILAPRRQVKICYSGWDKFWQDNNLQEGDVCAFEVVNSMNVEFEVTIFRVTDEDVGERGALSNSDISSSREIKEFPNERQSMKRKRGVPVKVCSTHLQRTRGKLRSGQKSSSVKNKSLEISSRDQVLQGEKAFFQSPNPHFIVIMKPAYVSNHSYLHIPPGPAKCYFPTKGDVKIKLSLKGGDGRVWTVKNYIGPSPYFSMMICWGWSKFSLDNNLQVGDTCVFELVNRKTKEFKVTIFRRTDGQVDKSDPLADEQVAKNDPLAPQGKLRSGQNSASIKNMLLEISARDRILQRAKAFQSPNPHFLVIMKQTYISTSYVHIPKGAAKSYFSKTGNKNIKLSVKGGDGRVWTVKNHIRWSPRFTMMISSGWNIFLRENNLQVGDICVFELVNSRAKELKVTIFRITDEQVDKKDPLVPRGKKEIPNEMQTRKRKRGVSGEEYTTPLQRAKGFKCEEPSFTIIMRQSYVEDWCRLPIPKAHASRYLNDQHGEEILLHRDDGKTWPVKCCTPGYTKFSYGWKNFVVDNDLKIGDACVFQLLPRMSNHYKVIIFRVAG